jgi:YggT family protein
MLTAYSVARYVVFAAFAGSALVALAAWLVRTRRISPFGAPGRLLRAATDPLIRPVETRLVRAGGNPVHAGWWLAVGVAAAGVVLLAAWSWVAEVAYGIIAGFSAGPRYAMVVVVQLAYRILVAALVVRVLASWFGYHRYTRWLRPAYALTDWVVEPIRRVIPPFGALDWSPLAAWLVLYLLERFLLMLAVGL